MLRYHLAAAALKMFSWNAGTRWSYRKITNVLGQRARHNRSLDVYIERCTLFLDLCRKYAAIGDGGRAFELGTGWLHFYSLYLRMNYDVRITTLDVWDNRQLAALKSSFARLQTSLPAGFVAQPHAAATLSAVGAADGYEALYAQLGMQHQIVADGLPRDCPDDSFDLVFSFHVLEHVPAANVPALLAKFYRMLKPGGVMIHQIGIDDHLAHYDARASQKNYLRYSERTWKWFFENDVQYFNRLQRQDWLRLLEAAGFRLEEETPGRTRLDGLPIAPRWHTYPQDDLACTILTIVHRKPAS